MQCYGCVYGSFSYYISRKISKQYATCWYQIDKSLILALSINGKGDVYLGVQGKHF